MFDIGMDEMALVAVVALVVIGPKDLPQVLRMCGQWVRKAREMAGEFQRGVDDMVRESELGDLKAQVEKVADPTALRREIEKSIDPTGDIVRSLEPPTFEPPPPDAPAPPEVPQALDVTSPDKPPAP